ncbi:hypothetical protein DUNSADRAFT_4708 [Dunaliella salina]|uniref:VWFA domain-containing protein n=1 Tax=Dunaliella salina TaxID=3046 RepID=A0ABQ7H7I8_DUNSA|nr:hypothetical protein DUNSADRAFT_4708 [Dunaliella salina]|eukprot:KAF5842824.1 hypothetical protein DUNSADRAFT_4708 [Dunaliella salina]
MPDEAQMHAQLMERLFGSQREGDWGGTEGGNAASVRAPGSMEEEQQEAEAAQKVAGVEEEAEEERRLLGLLAPEEAQALREQLDARLQDAAAGMAPAEASSTAGMQYGSEVWARCEALTAGLAGELAEQLRLILEPTQASKLAGDYRTGKRISMRKVIAYIASHFRKDKIWLRRSRPDKRRYQVLLAVDDSRSMAECGCGGMALEALTLLCKSMSRLEVGQIGVLKFGGPEGAVPLHSLSQPFSDAAGPGIMSALRFDQDNTIGDQPMLRLMETLEHTLEHARHEGGAGGIGAGTQDLAQLVLIVADGRLHEKEGLRARVRELASKRGVCLAFIAIDAQATTNTAASAAPQPRGGSGLAGGEDMMEADAQGSKGGVEQQDDGSGGAGVSSRAEPESRAELAGSSEKAGGQGGSGSSLLDMQTVSFVGGKPVFRKYMDDFPFPYYVLLRDIGALPRTLADMLRQWFEMSASS